MHPARGASMPDYKTETKSKYEIWWTFGWPYETSAAMARMVFSGFFDKWPNLKVLTHHMGAMAPYFEGRVGWGWDALGSRTSDEDYTVILKQLKNLSDEVALLLPDDLLWTDEHAWTPAVASTSYLITGALLIQSAIRQAGRPITLVGAADMAWVTRATVEQLQENRMDAWMQGRMEFGPRSLGTRSILGDARSPSMQKTLNLKVKYRESFRPFAPAVLREDVDKYFDIHTDSPYMLMVAPVVESRRRKMTADEEKLFGIEKLNVPRSDIPAVTHVDYSARIQTVHKETNPAFHDLLTSFKAKTGYSVVVNTSFNVRGEPIVCTPEDAFRCFMGSEIEVLVVGNCFLKKEDQDPALKLDYKNAFELD